VDSIRDASPPRPGSDLVGRVRSLKRAHAEFRRGDSPSDLRPVISASWRRSLAFGVDPDRADAPLRMDGPELEAYRSDHRLAALMPLVEDLLLAPAREAGLVVAVGDEHGRLLWVEGADEAVRRAEGIRFVPGSSWAERDAGTNAPGVALRSRRPVQVFAAEHYSEPVHPWSCAAAPIFDPHTGRLLGVLDVTGGPEVAAPPTLALVRATVAALGSELRMQLRSAPAAPRLSLLGRDRAWLQTGESGTRLSHRHGEILALLVDREGGLSAEQLDALLHVDGHKAVTTRAEVSRLRPLLAPIGLESRPYRLQGDFDSDVAEVRRLLAAGHLHEALSTYAGPLLPASDAPGVRAARRRLHDEVRHAVLLSRDEELMLTFARREGADDEVEVWQRLAAQAPTGSPLAREVANALNRLDSELR